MRTPAGSVLLVDPDAESRATLVSLLDQFVDGPVIPVGTAEDARDRLADITPAVEVALIDLLLWRAGGLQLVEALRAADGDVPIPILVMVREEDEHMVDAALAGGASDLLYRPIRPRELAARVHSAVRSRRDRLESARRERRLAEQSRELLDTKMHLERLVCVDPLTGLANRRHVEAILAGEWRRASRTGREMSLIIADLDQFHAYNELHGHPGGDTALRSVADALAAELRRPSDLLGRWGGEEFLALLPDTDADGARAVAERLRAAVERLGLPHAGSGVGVVTCSLGVATTLPEADSEPAGLVAESDQALFAAKRGGRNRVAVAGARGAQRPARRRSANCSDRWPAAVWVDPIYAERLPRALDDMRLAAQLLAEACEDGELDRARQIAEEIEDCAAGYGIEAIQTMARALSDAAATGDRVALEVAVEELRWYLDRVPVVYRQRTAEIQQLFRTG